MKKIFSLVFSVLLISLLLIPKLSLARDNVTDWYIKDLNAEFDLSQNSQMRVKEDIVADCGNLDDKHGIFRVLPTKSYLSTNEEVKIPVYLQGISDFSGKTYKYTETKDSRDNTITWKIGDANKEVKGVNNYRIIYDVKNVIRTSNPGYDEFYWNLNGSFWDLEIDNFTAKVTFPENFSKKDAQISLYSGDFKTADNSLAEYSWEDDRTLIVKSLKTLDEGQGITVSATAPKGVFTPYVFTTIDDNYYPKPFNFKNDYRVIYWIVSILGMALPLIAFAICFVLWRKYGDDPKFSKTIVPEFEIPNNLAPIEMGMVMTNGKLRNNFVTATIINLAVKGKIKIEDISKKGVLSQKDFKLIMLEKTVDDLSLSEKMVFKTFFDNNLEKKEVKLSDLKYKLVDEFKNLKDVIKNNLKKEKLIDDKGVGIKIVLIIIGVLLFFSSMFTVFLSGWLCFGEIISSIIIIIFAIIMPRRSLENLELTWKIKGFELYMKTAEKYRQKFNEKENILEKFLPYAILFGITDLWIKKMKDLYGEKYVTNYMPAWYVGSMGSFNIDTFSSTISNFSSNMNATMTSEPSSSGVGGGGFSGGGGGGGGGGGW